MTGRTVDAEEAERIGLVNRIVEGDPVEAGMAFAREFTGYSLPVLGFARSAVKRALDVPIHEGLKIEADLSTLAFQTKDAAEGMAAFEEKRKREFRRWLTAPFSSPVRAAASARRSRWSWPGAASASPA